MLGRASDRSPTIAAFAGAPDRFNFAPFNFIQTPLERYGAVRQAPPGAGREHRLNLRAVYNRRKSRNQAAPLPLFVGPDAGNGNLLDRITIDATNPFNPFGRLVRRTARQPAQWRGSHLRLHRPPGRRERAAPLQPERRHLLCVAATVDGSFEVGRPRLVLGRQRPLRPQQGRADRARQRQRRQPRAARSVRSPPAPRPACRSTSSAARGRSRGHDDYVAFTQNDSSRPESCGTSSANLSGELFELPGGPAGFAIGVEHRDQSGRFDPDPVVAAGLGSDIPALPTSGGFNVNEAYAELRLPLLSDTPFFHRLELTGAARYSDYSSIRLDRPRSAPASTGSRSRICCSAAAGPRASGRRRSANCSEPRRASTRRSSIPARRSAEPIPAAVGRQLHRRRASPPMAATSRPTRSFRSSPAAMPISTPETSESWGAGVVWRPELRAALLASRPIISTSRSTARSRRSTPKCCSAAAPSTGDPLSCAAITRTASGAIAQIRGLLQNIAVNRDRRHRVDGQLAQRRDRRSGRSASSGATPSCSNRRHRAGDQRHDPHRARGHRAGQPRPGLPAMEVDRDARLGMGRVRRVDHRPLHQLGVEEGDGNRLDRAFYTDLQLRWSSRRTASASRSAPTICSTSTRRPASPAASTTWTRPPTTFRAPSSTLG